MIRSFVRPTQSVSTVRNVELPTVGFPSYGLPGLQFFRIDARRPDAPQILANLQALSVQYGREPFIREFTRSILPQAIGDNALGSIVRTVLDFVQRRMRYVPDPEGTELVISPDRLIHQIEAGQVATGDCDDHVLLLNAMLRSAGFQTKVVGVKLYRRDIFDHVISSVFLHGRWIDLDPCAKDAPAPVYLERLEA